MPRSEVWESRVPKPSWNRSRMEGSPSPLCLTWGPCAPLCVHLPGPRAGAQRAVQCLGTQASPWPPALAQAQHSGARCARGGLQPGLTIPRQKS